MPEKTNDSCNRKENVCMNVDRVYDCCKDRDCMVDLRVYTNRATQNLINNAINVKPVSADLLWTYIDVEALPFNRGFYTVDIKFFFKTYFDLFTGVGRPTRIEGLATFDKRVILFGSEGGASIYSSLYVPSDHDVELMMRTNLPRATVEVVSPIMLSAKLVEVCEHHHGCDFGCGHIDLASVPSPISQCFDNDLCDNNEGKNLYTTLGLFSIVRLMREVQLLVPSYDFCIPQKECCSPNDDDPCSFFYKMEFPQDEFFPPKTIDGDGGCCPG